MWTYRRSTNSSDKFSYIQRTITVWNRLTETATTANVTESFHVQLNSIKTAHFILPAQVIVLIDKIIHDNIDINTASYLIPGGVRKLDVNSPTTNSSDKFSYIPRTINDWNRVTETTTAANFPDSLRM